MPWTIADTGIITGVITGITGTCLGIYNAYIAKKERRESVKVEVSRRTCVVRNMSSFPIQIVRIDVKPENAVHFGSDLHAAICALPIDLAARTSQSFTHSLAQRMFPSHGEKPVIVEVETGSGNKFSGKYTPTNHWGNGWRSS